MKKSTKRILIVVVIINLCLWGVMLKYLTRREQEIPHFYKWRDELRNTWR